MERAQLSSGDAAEPQIEGSFRILDIFRQGPRIFEESFLQHIAGIEPPLKAMIEAQRNQPPQAVVMETKQLPDRCRIGSGGLFEQFTQIIGLIDHALRPVASTKREFHLL